MTRIPLIAGNWKMNKTTAEAVTLTQQIIYSLPARQFTDLEILVCPPFTDLRSVRTVLEFERSAIQMAAQDVYWQAEGPFTGGISARMLAEIGCRYCLVGHSERRQYFAETDSDIAKKITALQEVGITPILCVGEDLATRQESVQTAVDFVLGQVQAALGTTATGFGSGAFGTAGIGTAIDADALELAIDDIVDEPATLKSAVIEITPESVPLEPITLEPVSIEAVPMHLAANDPQLVIAYEPIWSIGTGKTATPAAAQRMAKAIRKCLTLMFSETTGLSTRILYGGSLNAGNIALFAAEPDIDGGLVGGASLDVSEFVRLISNFRQAE